MDARRRKLERALRERPQDDALAADLARLALREGKPARALALLRCGGPPEERAAAARALAARLRLRFLGLTERTEVFEAGAGDPVILVPGGAFLDDGPSSQASILTPGGSRTPLRRVVLPDYLIGRDAVFAPTHAEARGEAHVLGGRLPTAAEWKKAWRGGLFLDGDLRARAENPAPDRAAPWAADAPDPGVEAESLYGVRYRLGVAEWLEEDPRRGAILDVRNGRYELPLAPRPERRVGWRLLREVPGDL